MPTPAPPPLPSTERAEPAPLPPAAEPPTRQPVPEPPLPDMPEEAPPAPVEEMPETPAKPDEVEDLFKDTDTKKPDAAPAEKPAEEPAKPADKPDEIEDLFKETDEKKAANVEQLPEPMDKASDSEVEDLFSDPSDKASKSASVAPSPATAPQAPAATRPATIEMQSPMRTWTDNTGKYHVRARLVIVGERYVRLLKDTGKYTTVRMERLSGSDLAFVQRQVSSAVAGNF